MRGEVETAAIGQVAAMLSERLGWKVNVARVDDVRRWLERKGWLKPLGTEEGAEAYDPVTADRIAGEAWRRRPGWHLRGKVVDDLFEAFVPVMGESDGIRRMLLPMRHVWDPVAKEMLAEIPDRIELYVYPTAEPCGMLTWTGETEDGLPVYVRES